MEDITVTESELVFHPRTLVISEVEDTDFGPEVRVSVRGSKGAEYGVMFIPVPDMIRACREFIGKYEGREHEGDTGDAGSGNGLFPCLG
jgi:hypothetical protein